MMNEEQIAKAREAKSAEELLGLAKENGMEMTEEEAADLYKRLHTSTELTDEELEDVAGGGCGSSIVKVDGVSYRKISDAENADCICFHYEFTRVSSCNTFGPFGQQPLHPVDTEKCSYCAHFVQTKCSDGVKSGYCNIPY